MGVTLITGASSGLGSEFARLAAADGETLVLVARNHAAMQKLANSLPVTCHVIALDLSTTDAAARLMSELHHRKLTVTTLINNAGFGDGGVFATSDPDRQQQLLSLNITALTMLTRLLLPGIIRAKGSILMLGSIASFLPGPGMAAYFASKAYVLNFSLALRHELAATGVGVTCLCPGPTATGFAQAARLGKDHTISRSTVSATTVASYGWQAMHTGKAIAVPGFRNKLFVVACRILPRAILLRGVAHFNA